MSNYCIEKEMPCEFANLNGYCRNSACTKLFSVTYEAHGFKPLTRADQIRAMSDEELANFINQYKDCNCCNFRNNTIKCYVDMLPCKIGILEWLQQPVDEENNG